MKIALAQINTTIGDFEGIVQKISDVVQKSKQSGAGLVIFPELTLTGYPPRDLLEDPDFIQKNLETLKKVAKLSRGIGILMGYVEKNQNKRGKNFFNAVAYCEDGKIQKKYFKQLLPNYDVFDESRYFEPGHELGIFSIRAWQGKVGISICEDAWNDSQFWQRPLYGLDPLKEQVKKGARLLINLSASPFYVGKPQLKLKMFSKMARRYRVPMVYVNLVGGNDELVFDGRSFVMNAKGQLVALGKSFQEDLVIFDTEKFSEKPLTFPSDNLTDTYEALVLGLRDYVRKCGFKKVVLGLSGGIDSSLVAVLAVEALGPENVLGVSMPSPYSSEGSKKDAEELAKNLKINFEKYPITDVYTSYRRLFQRENEPLPDLADENIQARIRGNILMTLSNRYGSMVLTTGNKSEFAMGYCTLYGDMSGGLAVISDLLKTKVYELCHDIQRNKSIIPPDVLTKAPSAELRPNQTDQDSLPPYETLDAILKACVENQKSKKQILKMGYDEATVSKVLKMIHANEYKRRQAAPGIKITARSFGLGRRYPLARKI